MNTLVLVVCALSQAFAAPSGAGGYYGPQALPKVLASGHLADTHEVAAAKAQHFSALAQASAHAGYGGHGAGGYADSYGHDGGYSGAGYSGAGAADHGAGAHGDFRYHGPIAVPHVLHDGHIADTHEVAAAKAEHFAAVAKAQSYAGYGHGGDDHSGRYAGDYNTQSGFQGAYHGGAGYVGAYHGPLANPVVLPSGYLADTHDVAAAKGQHHHALAQASHHAGAGADYYHH